MATLVKTFNWTASADSFTFTPNTNATGTWSSTGGDADAGCLSTNLSGRNKTDIGTWSRALTFEDMGVPSGSTITGITSASFKSQVTAWSTATSLTIGSVTLSDGSTTVTLAASRSPTGTDGAYQTHSGTNDTSLSWASTQSVTITINHNAVNGNAADAAITWLGDTLSFTIEYTAASTSMTAESGTFSLTGQSSGLLASRVLPAATGAFALTGNQAALAPSSANERLYIVVYPSTAAQPTAAQIVAGTDGDDTAAAWADDRAETDGGNEVFYPSALTSGVSYKASVVWHDGSQYSNVEHSSAFTTMQDYTIQVDVGAYALTGNAAALTASRTITADTASYALTGNAAALTHTTVGAYTLTAEPASFALTGQVANLLAGWSMPAAAASYALTGNAATLTYTPAGAYTMLADAASFALTGVAVTLTYTPAGSYTLTADAASFALTGQAVGLLADRSIQADVGAFSLTGQAANFWHGLAMQAEAGVFALTGNDAAFLRDYAVQADAGEFALTGLPVTLLYSEAAVMSGRVYLDRAALRSVTTNRTLSGIQSSKTVRT